MEGMMGAMEGMSTYQEAAFADGWSLSHGCHLSLRILARTGESDQLLMRGLVWAFSEGSTHTSLDIYPCVDGFWIQSVDGWQF